MLRLRALWGSLALAAAATMLPAGAVAADPPPMRVVTLAPHLAELVCAVGACERIVGVVRHSDHPPTLRQVTGIGDAHAVNLEKVLALRPELVLAWDGGTPPATLARLRDLGLRVEAIGVQRLDDIGMALLRVGALLGTEDAACAAQARYDERLGALRERYRNAEPIRVLYQLQADPVFTINGQSPISAALGVCGGINVFADLPQLAAAVSREAVLQSDPQAIVYGRQDDGAGIRRSWAGFSSLTAVRHDNLLAVNADTLARASPRMVDGISELCEALDDARRRLSVAR